MTTLPKWAKDDAVKALKSFTTICANMTETCIAYGVLIRAKGGTQGEIAAILEGLTLEKPNSGERKKISNPRVPATIATRFAEMALTDDELAMIEASDNPDDAMTAIRDTIREHRTALGATSWQEYAKVCNYREKCDASDIELSLMREKAADAKATRENKKAAEENAPAPVPVTNIDMARASIQAMTADDFLAFDTWYESYKAALVTEAAKQAA